MTKIVWKFPINKNAIGYIKGKNNRNIDKIKNKYNSINIKLVNVNSYKYFFLIEGYYYFDMNKVFISLNNIYIKYKQKNRD